MIQPSPTPDTSANQEKMRLTGEGRFTVRGSGPTPEDVRAPDAWLWEGRDRVTGGWKRLITTYEPVGGTDAYCRNITPLYAAREGWPADRERADRVEAALREIVRHCDANGPLAVRRIAAAALENRT